MPCLSISQPPAFFDITAPHDINLWVLILPVLPFLGGLLFAGFRFMPLFRRVFFSPQRHFYLWLGSLSAICLIGGMLLFLLILAWHSALDAWDNALFRQGCPPRLVIASYDQALAWWFRLLFLSTSLALIGGLLLYLWQVKAQKLVNAAESAEGFSSPSTSI